MAAPFTNFTPTSETMPDFLAHLPRVDNVMAVSQLGDGKLYKWEGSWYSSQHLEGSLLAKSNFEARDDDIILVSFPKAGTTWFKAILTAIMLETSKANQKEDLLVNENPHNIVKGLEYELYGINRTAPDLSGMSSPRIFHTHLPYAALPDSIKNSRCKIVCVARNAKDTFVSLYHFMNTSRTLEEGPCPLDRAFDDFCNGVHIFGPFLDHVLGYWKCSLNNVEKFMFIKYEDMKTEPKKQISMLAEFLGKPFHSDEEIEHVLWLCSIERLKNLEVNQRGSYRAFPHSSFFRLGVVGDWKNCLSKEMGERLDQITSFKLEGSGLDFQV